MERMWKLPLVFWQFKLKMLDFFGGAGSTCPGQAAAKCLEMGAACQAFSYDQTGAHSSTWLVSPALRKIQRGRYGSKITLLHHQHRCRRL